MEDPHHVTEEGGETHPHPQETGSREKGPLKRQQTITENAHIPQSHINIEGEILPGQTETGEGGVLMRGILPGQTETEGGGILTGGIQGWTRRGIAGGIILTVRVLIETGESQE